MIGILIIFIMITSVLTGPTDIWSRDHIGYAVILCLVNLLLIVDEIFCIIFLVSAHRKNSKLMKLCLLYNVFLFVASNIAIIILSSAIGLRDTKRYDVDMSLGFLISFIIFFVNAVLQIYFILLIRSEILKLNNGSCGAVNIDPAYAYCYADVPRLPHRDVQLTTLVQDEPCYDYAYGKNPNKF